MKVPFVDLNAQYQTIKTDVLKKLEESINKGDYILGDAVTQFENEFASYCGVKYGVGVGSGTEALHLALLACDIKDGDEVITVANTFIATTMAISMAGARPVLVDVDKDNYNMDLTKVEKAITKRTKAIIPVHLCGQPVDMERLIPIARKHGLKIIEDAAQAHGVKFANGQRAGSLGDLACFSFYPAKNLGCYGDGGIVVTNDEALAEKIKILRNYGQKVKNRHDIKSFNSRLDTIQAVVLRIKLAHLDEWNNKRRNNARFYQQYFEATPRIDKKLIKLPNPQTNDHIYHLYVLLAERRDALAEWLKTRGIATGCHYPVPIHLQPCYADLGYKKGDFPIAENYGARTISLPMYPELNEEQIKGVVASVKDFYTKV